MAVKALAVVRAIEAESDFTFRTRLEIFAEGYSSGPILSDTYFNPNDSEIVVKLNLFTFVRGHLLSHGITIQGDDTIRIIGLYEERSPTVALSADRLTAFWPMNETSGTRADAVGDNDLTQVGTVAYADPGKVGFAARFLPSQSAYLTLASSPNVQLGDTDFTVTCWVKPANVLGFGGDGPIFSFRKISLNRATLELWRTGNDGWLEVRNQNGVLWTSSLVLLDVWNLVVFSYRAPVSPEVVGTITIKVNGLLSGSNTVTPPLTDSDRFSIGGAGESSPVIFDGDIDAVSFYKRVLTDEEIVILYNNGAGQEYPFSPVLALPLPHGTGIVHVAIANALATVSLVQAVDIAAQAVEYTKFPDMPKGAVVGRTEADWGPPDSVTISDLLNTMAGAADGDIIYRSGGAWVRLPKGTAGQVLKMNAGGTAPEWASLV
jgi:hypothetical protein